MSWISANTFPVPFPTLAMRKKHAEVLSNLRLLARVSNNRQNGPLVSPALNCRLNDIVNEEMRQSQYTKRGRGIEIIAYLSGNKGFPSYNVGSLIDQYTIGTSTTFERSTTFFRQKFGIHLRHKKMDLLTDRYHSFRDILNFPPSHYTHLVGCISKFLAEAKHPVTWPRYDEYDHWASDMLRNLCLKNWDGNAELCVKQLYLSVKRSFFYDVD